MPDLTRIEDLEPPLFKPPPCFCIPLYMPHTNHFLGGVIALLLAEKEGARYTLLAHA